MLRLELLNFLLDYGSDLVGFEFHGHSCRSSADGGFAIGWRSSRRRRCRRCGARRRRSARDRSGRSRIGSPPSMPRRLVGDLLGHRVVERRRRWSSRTRHAAAQLVVKHVRLAVDRPQAVEPAVPRHDLEEVDQQRPRPAAPSTRSSMPTFSSGETRTEAKNRLELGKAVEHVGHQGVELVEHRVGRPAFSAASKQRLGIDVGDVLDARRRPPSRPPCGRRVRCVSSAIACGSCQVRRATWACVSSAGLLVDEPGHGLLDQPGVVGRLELAPGRSCRPDSTARSALRSASSFSAAAVAASISRNARCCSAWASPLALSSISRPTCSASRRPWSRMPRTSFFASASFCSYSARIVLAFWLALSASAIWSAIRLLALVEPLGDRPPGELPENRPAARGTRRRSRWPGRSGTPADWG